MYCIFRIKFISHVEYLAMGSADQRHPTTVAQSSVDREELAGPKKQSGGRPRSVFGARTLFANWLHWRNATEFPLKIRSRRPPQSYSNEARWQTVGIQCATTEHTRLQRFAPTMVSRSKQRLSRRYRSTIERWKGAIGWQSKVSAIWEDKTISEQTIIDKTYSSRTYSFPTENAAWARGLQGRNSMFLSQRCTNWAIVAPSELKNTMEKFFYVLKQVAAGMRFEMDNPVWYVVIDIDLLVSKLIHLLIIDRIAAEESNLISALTKQCDMGRRMILIGVKNTQAQQYSAIKKTCSINRAIPTQVVTSRIMSSDGGKLRSVATKIAIQMNAKLGGIPWHIELELPNCMYIGYDVCHDTRDKSRSFGAFVATVDIQKGRFYSTVDPHPNGEELSNRMALNTMKALEEYRKVFSKLPDRILFYRDGVGEGQFNQVYKHELQHVLTSLKQLYGANRIKLAYVIVSKRINTKFFLQCRGDAQNVPAGTVVDDVVTLREHYDFILVSQHVTQGTATPTHYNVLYDSFSLSPDQLQKLTYRLCHLYVSFIWIYCLIRMKYSWMVLLFAF